jgi:hypothetical protein
VQLKYGSYAFAVNGCEVTTRTSVIRSDTGRPIRYKVVVNVKAYIDGSGQADLTLKENQLRAVLAQPYGDLKLLQDSGADSSSALVSNNSITGVVITDGPHFGEAQGAEFINRRTAEFTGEAEYVINNSAAAVISFQEEVSIIGTGGPITNWRLAVNARPVEQVVYPFSTVRVLQVGTAVGHMIRPTAPPPFWSYPIEKVERRRITAGSARRVGPGLLALIQPSVSWQYEYESDRPLVALPNIPPL